MISKNRVNNPLRIKVKFLNLRKEAQSFTSAVEALNIMITGASTISAKENATPYAARLNLGSAILAIIADNNGPSVAIIIQVAARGIQKTKIFFNDNFEESDIRSHRNKIQNNSDNYLEIRFKKTIISFAV